LAVKTNGINDKYCAHWPLNANDDFYVKTYILIKSKTKSAGNGLCGAVATGILALCAVVMVILALCAAVAMVIFAVCCRCHGDFGPSAICHGNELSQIFLFLV